MKKLLSISLASIIITGPAFSENIQGAWVTNYKWKVYDGDYYPLDRKKPQEGTFAWARYSCASNYSLFEVAVSGQQASSGFSRFYIDGEHFSAEKGAFKGLDTLYSSQKHQTFIKFGADPADYEHLKQNYNSLLTALAAGEVLTWELPSGRKFDISLDGIEIENCLME